MATNRYSLSKYFGGGRGHVIRFHGSDTLLFQWNGIGKGFARHDAEAKTYTRNGATYPSLAALLRGVEAEHAR